MPKQRTRAADVAKVTKALTTARDPVADVDLDSVGDNATPDALRDGIRLSFLIHDVSRMRRSAYDNFMKPLGVTRAQWWVLAHLSRHDGMMQTQLATLLEVGKASLGDVIEGLDRNGWVERRPDPADKRAKRVYLTRSAQGLIKRMTEMEHEFNNQILGDLSAAQRGELARSLLTIKHAIARLDPDSAPSKSRED